LAELISHFSSGFFGGALPNSLDRETILSTFSVKKEEPEPFCRSHKLRLLQNSSTSEKPVEKSPPKHTITATAPNTHELKRCFFSLPDAVQLIIGQSLETKRKPNQTLQLNYV
jgi:hypothetical protein